MRDYKEVEWSRGARKGLRFYIPTEDDSFIQSKLELLDWKISSDVKIDDWWRNIKSYFPPWSSYHQNTSSNFSIIISSFSYYCYYHSND